MRPRLFNENNELQDCSGTFSTNLASVLSEGKGGKNFYGPLR